MGNILQNLFSSKKQHHCSIKKNKDILEENGDFIESRSGNNKKSKTIDYTESHRKNIHKVNNDPSYQGDDDNIQEKPSPFQRDFSLPPHEMLVPLEKYRPRRSNVRRSARQVVSKTKSNPLVSTDTNTIPFLDQFNKSNDFNKLNEQQQLEKKNEEEKSNNGGIVDELDPIERTKVRLKISRLLQKQQQIPTINNQRKYQSVFEPSLEYYQTINENQELHVEQRKNDRIHSNGDNDNDNILLCRPPKPKILHGNALLIDELKKRQSHVYESSREHHLVTTCAPMELN